MSDLNIKEALESVVGYIGEEVNTKLETKQDVFKVSEIAEATSSNVGSIVQYIGTSIPDSYQHNYFYECKAQGTDPETYAWEQANVQPSSEGDARVKPEITEIGVKLDDGYRPYIKVDTKTIIPTFENATWEDIALVADSYYNGDVSLEDIQEKWKLGDSRTFTLSSMSAETVREAHAEQTCTMRIVDFNHDALTEADGSITNALLTFAFLISENGSMKNAGSDTGGVSSGNENGWNGSQRRTWCNATCFNALPQKMQDVIKTVNKTYDVGGSSASTIVTADKLFIASAIELTNGVGTPMDSKWHDKLYGGGGGTQYAYYATNNLPISKTVYTSTTMGATVSSSYYYSYWINANANKSRTYARGDSAQGLLIHGCI